jgi:hypothetical protein
MEAQKIFEDFPTVDCNDCEKYWLNQCDGVQKAQKRICKEFLAVRRVNIPLQIKTLQEGIKQLHWELVGCEFAILVVVLFILYLITIGKIA